MDKSKLIENYLKAFKKDAESFIDGATKIYLESNSFYTHSCDYWYPFKKDFIVFELKIKKIKIEKQEKGMVKMKKENWQCGECNSEFFWACRKEATEEERKIPEIEDCGCVMDDPKTEEEWKEAELMVGACKQESNLYNEVDNDDLCKECKAKITKLKKEGLIK